jgi:pentatricopeptide repeat protein
VLHNNNFRIEYCMYVQVQDSKTIYEWMKPCGVWKALFGLGRSTMCQSPPRRKQKLIHSSPTPRGRAPRHASAPPRAAERTVHATPGMVVDCKRLVKSGRLGDGLDLFDRMPRRNVVAWTSGISGCQTPCSPCTAGAVPWKSWRPCWENPDLVSWTAAVSANFQNGFSARAVELLCRMHSASRRTSTRSPAACADLVLLDQGRQLHCLALKLGWCDFVRNMYSLIHGGGARGDAVPDESTFLAGCTTRAWSAACRTGPTRWCGRRWNLDVGRVAAVGAVGRGRLRGVRADVEYPRDARGGCGGGWMRSG